MARRPETDLFEPLRRYLEGQGYTVHSEVANCDVVARKRPAADEPKAASRSTATTPLSTSDTASGSAPPETDNVIAVELKSRLSLDLVVQAVQRKALTESVYIAVPLEGSRGRVRNLSGIKALLRRLEMGLFAVRFLRSAVRVEPILHPQPFRSRLRHKPRLSMVREIDGRYAEFDRAGQPSAKERVTAYKQQALLLAYLLKEHGECSPAALRRLSGIDRAGRILSANHLGWFERVRHGVYRLHPAGARALEGYSAVVSRILRSAGSR